MSGLNLQIDEQLVKPIIEAEVQAAIVRQLEKDHNLIPKMVASAVGLKVDRDGKVSRYQGDNNYTYIEWLCNDAIQKAAHGAMTKFIAENMPLIEAELSKQLTKSKKGLAAAFVTGLAESMKTRWTFKVSMAYQDTD